mgnify:FL=1
MFTWLKNLFSGTSIPEVINEVSKEEPKVETTPVEKPKKATTKEKKAPVKKTTATKANATKRGRKKTGVTKTDLNKMNKDQLEVFAKKEYKVDLDKRKRKSDLVDQVLALSK